MLTIDMKFILEERFVLKYEICSGRSYKDIKNNGQMGHGPCRGRTIKVHGYTHILDQLDVRDQMK